MRLRFKLHHQKLLGLQKPVFYLKSIFKITTNTNGHRNIHVLIVFIVLMVSGVKGTIDRFVNIQVNLSTYVSWDEYEMCSKTLTHDIYSQSTI